MKKGNATTILPEPAPNVNNTPEPQPFASCIPKPNISAPRTNDKFTGATLPIIPEFNPIRGIKKREQIAASRK